MHLVGHFYEALFSQQKSVWATDKLCLTFLTGKRKCWRATVSCPLKTVTGHYTLLNKIIVYSYTLLLYSAFLK